MKIIHSDNNRHNVLWTIVFFFFVISGSAAFGALAAQLIIYFLGL